MLALVIGVGISLPERVLHAVVVIGAIVVVEFLLIRWRKTRREKARAAGRRADDRGAPPEPAERGQGPEA